MRRNILLPDRQAREGSLSDGCSWIATYPLIGLWKAGARQLFPGIAKLLEQLSGRFWNFAVLLERQP